MLSLSVCHCLGVSLNNLSASIFLQGVDQKILPCGQGRIVSVLHQDEGGIGKSIPDARKISRDPRDFPRAKPEGNLEGRGKSGGQRGWISQYLPSFGGARTISQHQFFYREWIRKSFPVDREGLTVLKSILPC